MVEILGGRSWTDDLLAGRFLDAAGGHGVAPRSGHAAGSAFSAPAPAGAGASGRTLRLRGDGVLSPDEEGADAGREARYGADRRSERPASKTWNQEAGNDRNASASWTSSHPRRAVLKAAQTRCLQESIPVWAGARASSIGTKSVEADASRKGGSAAAVAHGGSRLACHVFSQCYSAMRHCCPAGPAAAALDFDMASVP